MKYLSTRDDSLSRSFNDILYQGLSRDGGLYLPQSWPKIDLLSLKNKSYEEVAYEIISVSYTHLTLPTTVQV